MLMIMTMAMIMTKMCHCKLNFSSLVFDVLDAWFGDVFDDERDELDIAIGDVLDEYFPNLASIREDQEWTSTKE